MLKRACVVLLVIFAAACSGSNNSPTAPNNLTMTVTSPDSNVYFNATEQMTATSSSGQTPAGTWTSDNPTVATVGGTGQVTPTGAGQAHIIFTATTGQQGNKLLRALPNLNGTFGGSYVTTSCSQSGGVASANLCGTPWFPGSTLQYTFQFTQSVDVVSGRFFLGQLEFDNVGGTIGLGGNLSVSGRDVVGGTAIGDTTWNLNASAPRTLGGSFAMVVTSTGLSGQANISGTITTVSQTASIPHGIVPLSLDDMKRAVMGR